LILLHAGVMIKPVVRSHL